MHETLEAKGLKSGADRIEGAAIAEIRNPDEHGGNSEMVITALNMPPSVWRLTLSPSSPPHRADQMALTTVRKVSSSGRLVSIRIATLPGDSGWLSNSQRRLTAAASGPPCFTRCASLSI